MKCSKRFVPVAILALASTLAYGEEETDAWAGEAMPEIGEMPPEPPQNQGEGGFADFWGGEGGWTGEDSTGDVRGGSNGSGMDAMPPPPPEGGMSGGMASGEAQEMEDGSTPPEPPEGMEAGGMSSQGGRMSGRGMNSGSMESGSQESGSMNSGSMGSGRGRMGGGMQRPGMRGGPRGGGMRGGPRR